MYRIIVLLLLIVSLTFGCATTRQPVGDEIVANMEETLKQKEEAKMTLEDIGISTAAFESMMSRIILLGHIIHDTAYGEIRVHFIVVKIQSEDGAVSEHEFMIGKTKLQKGILTTAMNLGTEETVAWLDQDEDGIPEIINEGGRNMKVGGVALEAYANVINALLQKPVYYPPSDDDGDDQVES